MCLSGGHLRLIAHYPFLVPMFPGPRYGTGLAFDVVLMGVGTSLDGHSASVHYCLSFLCYSPCAYRADANGCQNSVLGHFQFSDTTSCDEPSEASGAKVSIGISVRITLGPGIPPQSMCF